MEPRITENRTNLYGIASFNLIDSTGYEFNNTELVGEEIVLIDNGEPGYAILPEFQPPTLAYWDELSYGVTGDVEFQAKTNYETTFTTIVDGDISDFSNRGDKMTIRINLDPGASVQSIQARFNLTFSTIEDMDSYSYIDSDTSVPELKFSDEEKANSIFNANGRLLFALKDWRQFYSSNTHVQFIKMLREVEIYYGLANLFDRKAKQILMAGGDPDNFSAGDMNITSLEETRKTFYTNFQALSQIYEVKADEMLGLIIPPGTDADRSTFYFELNR